MPQMGRTNKPSNRPPRLAKTVADETARMAYTTIVLHPDQLSALKQVALHRQAERGGKIDSSAVLRDLLDAVASKTELPAGLQKELAAGLKERPRI
jgi:hypothetical protein